LNSANDPVSSASLSIVIASYNSARWLPSTLFSLAASLEKASWKAEVVVVNDGSTDNTVDVLAQLAPDFPVPLRVVNQKNMGRFLARWEGVQEACFDTVLLLDSRLVTHPHALDYLERAMAENPSGVWNGHVLTDPTAPLLGHFWSVPTYLFWGDYLSHPRPTLITPESFDRLPKGTGFLAIPKVLFERACLENWPTENARFVSDDTKLLRFVAAETAIHLDPGFSATYRPRTSFRDFLHHSWDRGTLFVDSYASTSTLRNALLVILATAPPVAALLLIGFAFASLWGAVIALAALVIAGLAAPAIVAALRRCPTRAVLSYVSFVIPFGITFWAGLARGLIIHRKSFNRNSSHAGEGTS
jgi:hypothetical protein